MGRHRPTLEQALLRAGLAAEGWRGWRCEMDYPVPLVEMRLALRYAGADVASGETYIEHMNHVIDAIAAALAPRK